MMTTIRNPLISADSLPNIHSIRTTTPLKSSFSTASSNLPDTLSTAVLHKRRTQKRVRFALKLERVEEDSLTLSRDTSASSETRSYKRVIDPWRQDGSLFGAYVEYLEKQDALTIFGQTQTHRTPPPPPPPPPEPGTTPPTYTHTFIIQSKSPELVIDSITISTPPLHLPRLIQRTTKSTKSQLPIADSSVKQQLTLSTPPRILRTQKVTNSSNQKSHYASVHGALKRAELSIAPTTGLHPNNKIIRPDNPLGSKLDHDYHQPKRMTEVVPKPLPGTNNQIHHFSECPIIPSYSKKPRIHTRTHPTNNEANVNTSYFFQNHNNDHLFQPVIHSTH